MEPESLSSGSWLPKKLIRMKRIATLLTSAYLLCMATSAFGQLWVDNATSNMKDDMVEVMERFLLN